MTNQERRQTPRSTIATHAYINIEPNNGGIVLNVSDGGLCFHSFDPVQRNGKIRFWFSDHKQRIEANGTLAWTDETQKGGLRFTALPAEAREQIHHWMSQPTTPLAVGDGSALTGSPARSFPALSGKRPDTKAAPVGPAPTLSAVSPDLEVPRQDLRVPKQLSGFYRGLITGLLVSAVVVAAFLFQSYRRELGESLIRLGERFAAKPSAQTVALPEASPMVLPGPPAPQAVLAAAGPIPPAASAKTPPQPEKSVIPPEKHRVQPDQLGPRSLANEATTQPAKLEPASPPPAAIPTAVAMPAPKLPATASAPAVSSTPSTIFPAPAMAALPTTALAPGSNSIPVKLSPAPKLESANPPVVQTESSAAENAALTSELYFDVGKFKNQSQAHIEINKLTQLGFPALAVQKGFLWANSYHVLVGPYGDEERAKSTHQNLVSSGFKPRAFERGSRAFTLSFPVTLNGARAPAGDYTISWESYLDDASVKFLHNDYAVATANGKWVKREVKYPRDAYVYRRNADGSRTLLEIRFGGTRQALVFGKPS